MGSFLKQYDDTFHIKSPLVQCFGALSKYQTVRADFVVTNSSPTYHIQQTTQNLMKFSM